MRQARTTEGVCTQSCHPPNRVSSSGVEAGAMSKHNNYLRGVYFDSVETE